MAERIPDPTSGTRIDYRNNQLVVPDHPVVAFIERAGATKVSTGDFGNAIVDTI